MKRSIVGRLMKLEKCHVKNDALLVVIVKEGGNREETYRQALKDQGLKPEDIGISVYIEGA